MSFLRSLFNLDQPHFIPARIVMPVPSLQEILREFPNAKIPRYVTIEAGRTIEADPGYTGPYIEAIKDE